MRVSHDLIQYFHFDETDVSVVHSIFMRWAKKVVAEPTDRGSKEKEKIKSGEADEERKRN